MTRVTTTLLLLVVLPVVAATGQTANIQFVNAAADSELPAVDIYVNGELMVDGLAYGMATPFLEVPANEPLDFELAAAGGDPSAPLDAFSSAGYGPDSRRFIVVSGMLRPDRVVLPEFASERDLALSFHVVAARATVENAGWFGIQLFQAAADLPPLDWHVYSGACARSNYLGTAWWDVDFGQFSEYIESPPLAGYGVIADTSATEQDECAEWSTWLVGYNDFSQMANTILLQVLMGWVVPPAGEDSLRTVLVHADGSVVDADSLTVRESLVSVVSDTEPERVLPTMARLLGNYPNPFNPSTTIEYELATPSRVRLEVFDLLGRRAAVVVDEFVTAGVHEATWTAPRYAATGLHVARLTAGSRVATRPMLLLK